MNNNLFPLVMMAEGQKAKIAENLGYGKRMARHLEDLGLNIGSRIEIISQGSPGPWLISVKESSVAIGKGLAEKIMVERY